MISNQTGMVEYYDPFAEWIGQHIKKITACLAR